jgi:hypothetical protein
MAYRIKREKSRKCRECNGEARAFYKTKPICCNCLEKLKYGNILENIKF